MKVTDSLHLEIHDMTATTALSVVENITTIVVTQRATSEGRRETITVATPEVNTEANRTEATSGAAPEVASEVVVAVDGMIATIT